VTRSVAILWIALLGCRACWADALSEYPQLDFLTPGVTSKTEVFLHFGRPYMTFEDEKILIYLLAPVNRSLIPLRERREGQALDLVLAFDVDGMLQRRTLVRQ